MAIAVRLLSFYLSTGQAKTAEYLRTIVSEIELIIWLFTSRNKFLHVSGH